MPRITVFAAGLMSAASLALAADPLTDAMQQAYAPYRVARFKTNGKAQDEARQAVIQAQEGWARIAAEFGASPPLPYASDPRLSASLGAVSQVYAKALDEIGRDRLAEAHETLEEVRDIMADMRRRSQVVVFSDHMNAYHAEMERFLNDGERTLAAPNGMLELTAQAGTLEYLAGRLKSEAPGNLAKSDEFSALLKAVEKSVADLKAALFAQDPARVKEAMGKLKQPYSRMFIKFG